MHTLALAPGLIIQTYGSYRRRKAKCGDVDILTTHADGISHEGLLVPLIDSLKTYLDFVLCKKKF